MTYQNVRGTRDFLPAQMRKKQFVEDCCRAAFELYGYQPLQTPALEDLKLLGAKGGAGEEIKKEIYAFKDQGGREIGMRFDFTVPLGRVVATNKDLPRPFKRYQIGPVWRYDRPQASRYREFTQADIDIVGSPYMTAEADVLACALEAMKRMELDATIRINNRKLLESIALKCGVAEKDVVECFRCIDKADKIGWDGVARELRGKKISTKVLDALKESGSDFGKVEAVVGKEDEGLRELREVFALMEAMGLADKLRFDVSMARGLEYYTGPVFEVEVAGAGVSCGAGGRFDNLVEAFGGAPTPAVGISFGVDRVVDVLEDRLPGGNKTKAFVAPVSDNVRLKALEVVQQLRAAGVNAEIDVMNRGIGKSIQYADRAGIPWVVIVGEKELAEDAVTVREMASGKEERLPLGKLGELAERRV